MRETSLDEFVGEADAAEADGANETNDEETPGNEAPTPAQRTDDTPDPPHDEGVPTADAAEDGTPSDTDTDGRGPDSEWNETPATEDDQAGGDQAATGSAVTPAVSTYSWTPRGADCSCCGETVERRWRDDGDLVCSGCTTW